MVKRIFLIIFALLFLATPSFADEIIIIQGAAPSAYEDFTTYTCSEGGGACGSLITSVTSTKITWVALHRDIAAHVYKNFGVDYFNGDFTFLFEVQFSNENGSELFAFVSLQNAIQDLKAAEGANADLVSFQVWDENLRIGLLENGSWGVDAWAATTATTYYITFARDYDGGANNTGQYTAQIRTGSHTGTLQHTLSIDSAVGEQNDFRYLYGVNSFDDNGATNYADGYTENLNITG